jgi:glutamate dehydrogenase (NAD(P)+)
MNTQGESNRQAARNVVTGKSVVCGGSLGRAGATGQGILYVLQEMLPELKIDLRQMRFSVLGFGNVGSNVARLLQQRGATLVAVLDHTGALRGPDGLDAEALNDHVSLHGGVAGFKGTGAASISPEDFYHTPVDVFIPAALERMVNEDVVRRLQCKVVAEGGNGPRTAEAVKLLEGRGITVLPAILCNPGGVSVSYMEWVQNKTGVSWDLARVNDELCRTITDAARRVRARAKRHQINYHTAAYVEAIDHIGMCYQQRGIFP